MLTFIFVLYKSDKKKLKSILNKISKNHQIIFIINSENYNLNDLNIIHKHKILITKNNGNGAAINLGLKNVKTKYALYMDVDISFEKDFFDKMIDYVKKNSNFAMIVPNHGNLSEDKETIEKYDGEASVMLLNLEKTNIVNNFDEKYFLYFEEVDLMYQLKRNKEKVLFLTKLKIKHERAKSIKNESNEIKNVRAWHYMWSMFYFYKKNYNFFFALKKISKLIFIDFLMCVFYFLTFDHYNCKIRFFRIYGATCSILNFPSFLRP